jgi:2-polyprenyl-6-methoxyphenol hydroxylase-like FAD-dependent oxidoreductase
VCFVVVRQYTTKAESDKEKIRNPEWAPETSTEMIEKVKDFKTPWGTLGDLFDQTPKDKISRVFLEDKLFETWTHGRTVLIGDAAHKVILNSPASSRGILSFPLSLLCAPPSC